MKYAFLIFLPFLLLVATPEAQAQQADLPKVITDSITVTGVCGMCEERIEEAARYVSGVKLAEWDKEAQMLKVVFKTKRCSLEDIANAVADAGHDSELAEASAEAYQALPDCCLYRDGVEVH